MYALERHQSLSDDSPKTAREASPASGASSTRSRSSSVSSTYSYSSYSAGASSRYAESSSDPVSKRYSTFVPQLSGPITDPPRPRAPCHGLPQRVSSISIEHEILRNQKWIHCRIRRAFGKYIKHALNGQPERLKTSITLNGTVEGHGLYAVAMTCEEYVAKAWPGLGPLVLDDIVYALSTRSDVLNRSRPLLGLDMSIIWFENDLIISILGVANLKKDVLSLLCWLVATWSQPVSEATQPHDCLVWSSVESWMAISLETFSKDVEPKEEPKIPQDEYTCWYPLFAGFPLVQAYSSLDISKRTANDTIGKGLELPFDLMLILSGTLYSLVFERGVVLRGHSNVLFPVAGDENEVQWHLMEVSLPEDIPGALSGRHRLITTDMDLLARSKTFLGYASDIHVRLGTREAGADAIGRSGAPGETSSLQVCSYAANAGTSGLGFFGGNIGATFSLTKPLRANIQSSSISTDDLLLRSSHQPILMYDETTSRAYLVPELSLVLHCLHSWAKYRDLDSVIPFASLAADGGFASLQIIKKNAKKLLEVDADGQHILLIDKIRLFLVVLRQRREATVMRAQEEGFQLGKSLSLSLLAWDYLEIVEFRQFPKRREIKVGYHFPGTGTTWPLMVRDNPDILVICCSNLGTPIVPTPQAGLCSSCSSVPHDAHFLTATVRCLRAIDASGKFSNRLFWENPLGRSPFAECGSRTKGLCERLQKLSSRRREHPHQPHWIDRHLDAAVAFPGTNTSSTPLPKCNGSVRRQAVVVHRGIDTSLMEASPSGSTSSTPQAAPTPSVTRARSPMAYQHPTLPPNSADYLIGQAAAMRLSVDAGLPGPSLSSSSTSSAPRAAPEPSETRARSPVKHLCPSIPPRSADSIRR